MCGEDSQIEITDLPSYVLLIALLKCIWEIYPVWRNTDVIYTLWLFMEAYVFIPRCSVRCCVTYVVCSQVIVTNLYELSISVDQSLSGNLTAFKLVKQFRVVL